MRTSINYLHILAVIIAIFWGCNTDIPQPVEEKKHIDKALKVIQAEVEKDYLSEYVKDLFEHPGFSASYSSYSQATAENATVKDYTFKVNKKDDDGKVCMDIFRSGRKLRSDCANSIIELAIIMEPDPGTDINGDGVPEVIVYEETAEWHCCSIYVIFSLGKNLKLIDTLYGEH
jgi:hypothetical protein